MRNLRWERWLCLFALVLSGNLWASAIYTSPTLNEANSLVDIVPKKSRRLAMDFLAQRKLTETTEKSPSSISRDEADNRTRTPGATIDALKILADAEFNLGNPLLALKHLAEARALTQAYQLPYLGLDVQLHQIRLEWKHTGNAIKAREQLHKVDEQYQNIKNPEQLAKGLRYQLSMLKAEIASKEGEFDIANNLFAELKPYVDKQKSSHTFITYHTTVGKHLLAHKKYNRALSEFLISYWKAIEEDSGALLAQTNHLLGELFYNRRVLDKANEHLSQAADFYDNYENSPLLPPILKLMGDIYYHQGKYNLALVHYFNAMDHERMQNNITNVIDIRISLAATYLKLVNFPLTEQYLDKAQDLLQYVDEPKLQAYAYLLEAGLASHQREADEVLDRSYQALKIANQLHDISIQKSAYQLIHRGYTLKKEYKKALEYLRQYNALSNIEQQQLDLISEDAFRQQKEFVEQTLHLVGQKEELVQTKSEYRKFQKIAFAMFVTCLVLLIFGLRRGHIVKVQNEEIDNLNQNLFTHSRSGLRNLRMLNAKLPASLEATNGQFEKWHVGELIHEPLNDRLRFVMIDVPFLRNLHMQHGYSEGLKLEKEFGEYLKEKITSPARVYHFSDANLLYIEPNSNRDNDPQALVDKLQQWIIDFKPRQQLNRVIRVGMVDYPFLPRAYTALNDKQLLDILLMATGTARTLSLKESSSQWVYLKAIDNAPAASLATGNVRKACKHAISQGLIKVHSSYNNEDSIKKLLKDV
ncbi:tetratricopeptide repeat protein [Vibrio sp. LaRot3]|uniref:tetratricopeptide repeat protein n=1 Tax=Vibrio sp. LaRot3 TaxID=2998829 RepID=UPI0022CE053A|nr:tetratricopeptide repeat protein [Vibrio sp. LaRot3]MDA0149302.1 tetratricopeptide repeat protein [Vibrio sp. LaRot3]